MLVSHAIIQAMEILTGKRTLKRELLKLIHKIHVFYGLKTYPLRFTQLSLICTVSNWKCLQLIIQKDICVEYRMGRTIRKQLLFSICYKTSRFLVGVLQKKSISNLEQNIAHHNFCPQQHQGSSPLIRILAVGASFVSFIMEFTLERHLFKTLQNSECQQTVLCLSSLSQMTQIKSVVKLVSEEGR